MKTLSLEISAIRLQLKHLAADREVIADERKRRNLEG